jgi:hypothetical protein
MSDPVLSIVMPFSGQRELSAALGAATALGMQQIGWYGLPPLYSSGVRYVREVCRAPNVPGACERFLTPAQSMVERDCDCDDLAVWRAAELQLRGERARAVAIPSSVGWHVVVRRADGTIEDPSKILGMRG